MFPRYCLNRLIQKSPFNHKRYVRSLPCSRTQHSFTHTHKNKTAVISGDVIGIGYDIAANFLKKGARQIILLDNDVEEGTEATKALNCTFGDGKCVFTKCDVLTDLEHVTQDIFDCYKYVDIFVNNTAFYNNSYPRKIIDTNLTSLVEWSYVFWNHMRKDQGGKGGTIMNLSSIYGNIVDPYFSVYQCTAFGVMGFTRSLGRSDNFKKTGVRVLSVKPELSYTKLVRNFLLLPEMCEALQKSFEKQALQNVAEIGRAAVNMLERAESGTTWLIEGAKSITEIKYDDDVGV